MPSYGTTTATITNTVTKNNTKITEELAAAASSLRKYVNDITGLITSLTRNILPFRAVNIDVDVDKVSINWEEEGGRGVQVGADKE